MLLETGEQILEADRDRATLLVLHLHRRAVEAEELPDLLHRERDRAVDDFLLERCPFGPSGMSTIAFAGTPFGNAVMGARIAAPPVSVSVAWFCPGAFWVM